MNKILKCLGIIVLSSFSLLYITQINSILLNHNNLKKYIESKILDYYNKQYDAKIYGDYIIPGIVGSEVNIIKSYYSMKSDIVFNESLLVYDEILPEVSIVDNKDKFIEKGNPNRRNIAIILENNPDIEKFLISENINANKLITYNQYDNNTNLELINNEVEKFSSLTNLNNNICVINEKNLDICKSSGYYLIKINEKVDNTNYMDFKSNLHSGQILYLSNDFSFNKFVTIYREILFKDYQIVYLSKMIEE